MPMELQTATDSLACIAPEDGIVFVERVVIVHFSVLAFIIVVKVVDWLLVQIRRSLTDVWTHIFLPESFSFTLEVKT